jgi:Tol biopolymer transport system component
MMADGTNARTIAPSIEMRSSLRQSAADWSPDGKWIVAAGADAQGPGLFKISVDTGAVARIVSGPLVNPVWSPDGTMIVYGGAVVSGQLPLLAVRPDGTPVILPGTTEASPLMARIGGGHRFLPDGTGLVYLPRAVSLDFWLLDLVAGSNRQITRLEDRGSVENFDVTPDGRHIVFDRSRQNSDVYLIELPNP